jgi:DNA mismatch endonuclease (patch repair protein)
MRRIRGRDTRPEWAVRRVAHGMGYRYRLHDKGLPGSPDLVFSARRKVVFVHGCFWHAHGCAAGQHPKTRPEYWAARFARNKERDSRNLTDLAEQGWQALVVWECETKDAGALRERLADFLGCPATNPNRGGQARAATSDMSPPIRPRAATTATARG